MIHVPVDPEESLSNVVNHNYMDANEANYKLDDLVALAKSTTVSLTLNQLSQYMSLYH
ncbi:MAG: hypothetical protein UR43_C0019G0026 [candidate division TM6 bacterium GW2011_GWF2_33_332]|nr:MAG: hypothetical protein UR43_C0019G0026 [candidate division TM6 bacterium GW2011_GWF2_33_332]